MQNARLDEAQAGIKTARRNINNLRYADDTTLMTERKEELKSLLIKVKEAGLKLNIKKMKIMTSSPITSWQRWGNNGNNDRLYFFSSKSTADGDCSHEIQKMLAPWEESYDQPRQHIKKQRHYFADKSLSGQSYCFSSSHV